jgi:hypothetical protein
VVLQKIEEFKADYRLEFALRGEGQATIQLYPPFNSGETACYLLFVKPRMLLGDYAEEYISNSMYCGTIKV